MTAELGWHPASVMQQGRLQNKPQRPCVIWLTGLSGAGKSSVANAVEQALVERGAHTYLLDGDNLRHGLCRDLGFSPEDRHENIRRVAEVAALFVDAGLIVIAALISPLCRDRQMARTRFAAGGFVEVFVDTPLAVCEQRDPKGLYRKARSGQLPDFTGISAPYEPPVEPEVHLQADAAPIDEQASRILDYLLRQGYLAGTADLEA